MTFKLDSKGVASAHLVSIGLLDNDEGQSAISVVFYRQGRDQDHRRDHAGELLIVDSDDPRYHALLDALDAIKDPDGPVYYTITAHDVGWKSVRWRNVRVPVGDLLGRILAGDVGKRIYRSQHGVLTVENDEQRDARIAANS